MPSTENTLLADRPPAERRIIVIGERPAAANGGAGTVLTPLAVGAVAPFFVALPVVVVGGVAWWLYNRNKTGGAGPSGVLPVPPSLIDRRTRFPPGHPSPGTAYVLNPVRPDVYVVMAEFHRVALREKAGELFRLLAELRAETATIEVVRGKTKQGGGNVELPLPTEIPVQIGLAGKARSGTAAGVSYDAKFDGTGAPRVPSDLKWFEHEPEWQEVARARTDSGLVEFTVTLRYSDDFGVNVKLKVGLEGMNVKLGGHFEEFSAEEWIIRGRFRKKPTFGW